MHYRVTRSTNHQADKSPEEKPDAINGLPCSPVDNRTGLVTSHHTLTSEQMSNAIELLRQFDMTFRYGPCVGIPRTVRWERARNFGLNPPEEVGRILQNEFFIASIPDLDRDIWHDQF